MIIKPIYDGTRLRQNHTTYAAMITSCGVNSVVEGNETWIAQADGDQVRRGDMWLHVTKINGVAVSGWMAIIHLGKTYCVITDSGEVVTPPAEGVVEIVKAVVTAKMSDGSLQDFTLLPE